MKNDVADAAKELKEATQELKSKAYAMGSAAWDATKDTYQGLHDKTLEYSRVTDQAIRRKPYAALGIAFGVGLVLGFLLTNRKSSDEDEE